MNDLQYNWTCNMIPGNIVNSWPSFSFGGSQPEVLFISSQRLEAVPGPETRMTIWQVEGRWSNLVVAWFLVLWTVLGQMIQRMDSVERSVSECHDWAFAKQSFLTWLESVLSPILLPVVVLQMFASSSMMTKGEVTLVATSDRIHSRSSQKCSHFLRSWQGSNVNKHTITNIKLNVCLHCSPAT